MALNNHDVGTKHNRGKLAGKKNKLSLQDKKLFPTGRCRLILIGKTGAGKSSTGNAILGQTEFKPQVGINSETKECDVAIAEHNGLELLVVDTPGLCDTDKDDVSREITNSLLGVHPGPHAIILVLKCDARFTEQEYKVYNMLKDLFGPAMSEYLIVIFTGKDDIVQYGVNFHDQLQRSFRLKSLLKEVDDRYVLFNNNARHQDEREQQVEELLVKVRQVVRHNKGKCFRHNLHSELNFTMIQLMKEEARASIDIAGTAGKSAAVDETRVFEGAAKESCKKLAAKSLPKDSARLSSEEASADCGNQREREISDLQSGHKKQTETDASGFVKRDNKEDTKEETKVEEMVSINERRLYFEKLLRPERRLDVELLPAPTTDGASASHHSEYKSEETKDEPSKGSLDKSSMESTQKVDNKSQEEKVTGSYQKMAGKDAITGSDKLKAVDNKTLQAEGRNSLEAGGHKKIQIVFNIRVKKDAGEAATRGGKETTKNEQAHVLNAEKGIPGTNQADEDKLLEREQKESEDINVQPDREESLAMEWTLGQHDVGMLLSQMMTALNIRNQSAEPSLMEKKCLVEDEFRKKVLNRPNDLTTAQREIISKSSKTVDQEVKCGMEKHALKTIVQCCVM